MGESDDGGNMSRVDTNARLHSYVDSDKVLSEMFRATSPCQYQKLPSLNYRHNLNGDTEINAVEAHLVKNSLNTPPKYVRVSVCVASR